MSIADIALVGQLFLGSVIFFLNILVFGVIDVNSWWYDLVSHKEWRMDEKKGYFICFR